MQGFCYCKNCSSHVWTLLTCGVFYLQVYKCPRYSQFHSLTRHSGLGQIPSLCTLKKLLCKALLSSLVYFTTTLPHFVQPSDVFSFFLVTIYPPNLPTIECETSLCSEGNTLSVECTATPETVVVTCYYDNQEGPSEPCKTLQVSHMY